MEDSDGARLSSSLEEVHSTPSSTTFHKMCGVGRVLPLNRSAFLSSSWSSAAPCLVAIYSGWVGKVKNSVVRKRDVLASTLNSSNGVRGYVEELNKQLVLRTPPVRLIFSDYTVDERPSILSCGGSEVIDTSDPFEAATERDYDAVNMRRTRNGRLDYQHFSSLDAKTKSAVCSLALAVGVHSWRTTDRRTSLIINPNLCFLCPSTFDDEYPTVTVLVHDPFLTCLVYPSDIGDHERGIFDRLNVVTQAGAKLCTLEAADYIFSNETLNLTSEGSPSTIISGAVIPLEEYSDWGPVVEKRVEYAGDLLSDRKVAVEERTNSNRLKLVQCDANCSSSVGKWLTLPEMSPADEASNAPSAGNVLYPPVRCSSNSTACPRAAAEQLNAFCCACTVKAASIGVILHLLKKKGDARRGLFDREVCRKAWNSVHVPHITNPHNIFDVKNTTRKTADPNTNEIITPPSSNPAELDGLVKRNIIGNGDGGFVVEESDDETILAYDVRERDYPTWMVKLERDGYYRIYHPTPSGGEVITKPLMTHPSNLRPLVYYSRGVEVTDPQLPFAYSPSLSFVGPLSAVSIYRDETPSKCRNISVVNQDTRWVGLWSSGERCGEGNSLVVRKSGVCLSNEERDRFGAVEALVSFFCIPGKNMTTSVCFDHLGYVAAWRGVSTEKTSTEEKDAESLRLFHTMSYGPEGGSGHDRRTVYAALEFVS